MASTLLFGGRCALWRRQLHAGLSGFGKSNGYRLLGILDAMLPFSHVMDFFADKLSGLRRSRLPFASILPSLLHGLFLWHVASLPKGLASQA
jgi:hypothetical protein